jgi:hypothetical protein
MSRINLKEFDTTKNKFMDQRPSEPNQRLAAEIKRVHETRGKGEDLIEAMAAYARRNPQSELSKHFEWNEVNETSKLRIRVRAV